MLLCAGCASHHSDVLRIATGDSGEALSFHRRIVAIAETRGLRCRLEPVSGGDYYTRLLTQLASSDPPDIMQLGDDAVPPFVARGVLRELGPEFPLGEFIPQVVEPGRWRGQLFMLPKDYTTFGIYCNLKLFRKYGVPLPTPDWTVDDFVKTARALTRDGNWGVILPGTTPATLELWSGVFGGRVVTPEGNYAGALDSPHTIDALKFWASLYHRERVTPMPVELGSDSAGNFYFEQGRAGMRLAGRWFLPSLRQNPEVELAVLPPPRGLAHANLLYWAGFGMAREAPHPQQAAELLRIYTGPEAAEIWKDWALPAVSSVAVSAGFTTDPLEKVWLAELDHVVPRAYTFEPNWTRVGDRLVRRLLETALLCPEVDLEAAARTAAQEAQTELERIRSR